MSLAEPPDSNARTALAWRIALAVAVLVAAVVRVLFLADKPFWRDEGWVALLVDTPWRAITDGRGVPIGFLWLVRMTRAIVPGPPEVSYRAVPLLVGIAIVPLLARAATRFGATRAVAVAVAWIAVGLAPLVYYSRELKSYDLDFLLALVVPLLGVAGFCGERPNRAARGALLALLVVAPWVSFAGIFPIAALLSWAWLVWARGATPEERRDLFVCSAAFTASFVAVYFLALSSQVASPRLLAYWHSQLLGVKPIPVWNRAAQGFANYVRASSSYFFGAHWPWILAIAAIGAVTWPGRHRLLLLWMYAGTAAWCVAAAVTDHYLIAHGRHLLFALPPLLLWTAQGLWVLARPFGLSLRPAAALALPITLALVFSAQSVGRRLDPYRTDRSEFFRYDVLQNVDEAIAATEKLAAPGDAVILSLRTGYAFQFYRHGRLPQAKYCERSCPNWDGYAKQWLRDLHGPVWLILADEEDRSFAKLFAATGFTGTERAKVRGARVWELNRVTASDASSTDRPSVGRARARPPLG